MSSTGGMANVQLVFYLRSCVEKHLSCHVVVFSTKSSRLCTGAPCTWASANSYRKKPSGVRSGDIGVHSINIDPLPVHPAVEWSSKNVLTSFAKWGGTPCCWQIVCHFFCWLSMSLTINRLIYHAWYPLVKHGPCAIKTNQGEPHIVGKFFLLEAEAQHIPVTCTVKKKKETNAFVFCDLHFEESCLCSCTMCRFPDPNTAVMSVYSSRHMEWCLVWKAYLV